MDYLSLKGRSLREQRSYAAQRLLSFGGMYDPTISDRMAPLERVERLAQNFDRGYFVVPYEPLFAATQLFGEGNFSRKRGPLQIATAEKDLRPLRSKMYADMSSTLYVAPNFDEIPSQLAGMSVGLKGIDRYIFRNTDVVSALMAYDGLRTKAKPYKQRNGRATVTFGSEPDAVRVEVYGIGKGKPGRINAQVLHLPSRAQIESNGKPTHSYAPQYTLETLVDGVPAEGIFEVKSSTTPHDTFNRTTWRVWNKNVLTKDTHDNARVAQQQRKPLYFQDILGIFLVDALARQYGVEVNHPFKRFTARWRQLAYDLYKHAIIIREDRAMHPNKTQLEQLYNMALSVRGAEVAAEPQEWSRVQFG